MPRFGQDGTAGIAVQSAAIAGFQLRQGERFAERTGASGRVGVAQGGMRLLGE